MKLLSLSIFSLLFSVGTATEHLNGTAPVNLTTTTCADPSLAEVFNYFWIASWTDNYLDYSSSLVTLVTQTEPITYLGPAAYVFRTQQPGTIPLYSGFSVSLQDHRFLLPDALGNAPSAPSGYVTEGIVAYVYPSQTCGSVPLFALFNAASKDWAYTADPATKAGLLQSGYVDEGDTGFVLPVPTVCGCSS